MPKGSSYLEITLTYILSMQPSIPTVFIVRINPLSTAQGIGQVTEKIQVFQQTESGAIQGSSRNWDGLSGDPNITLVPTVGLSFAATNN